MAVIRQARLQLVETDRNSEENLSFFERFKRDSERNRKNGSSSRALCVIMRFLMVFTGTTEPYVFMYYIIPYMFEGYSPWTMYYMKVVVWFFVINMVANWTCLILYDTSFAKTKDNPFIHFDQQSEALPDKFSARIQQFTHTTERNGQKQKKKETDAEEILSWHYCDKCDMRVPPRAHHCKICRKCILKRDHHCFMVGSCIGFKNQRYFIMMCFYISVCGLLGGSLTLMYVKNNVWPVMNSWADMILPVTLVRFILGYVQGIHCVLVTQIYLELIFGAMSFLYFNSQITFLAHGKTPHEVSKKIPLRNTNTFSKNLQSVFGDCWFLNFVFPMTLVFKQRKDGLTWDELKIDNSRYHVNMEQGIY